MGKEAFQASHFDRAKQSFERLRSLEQRGKIWEGVSPSDRLSLGANQPMDGGELGRALARVQSTPFDVVGSAGVSKHCRQGHVAFGLRGWTHHFVPGAEYRRWRLHSRRSHLPPGNHILDVGAGKTELVRVQAGTSVTSEVSGLMHVRIPMSLLTLPFCTCHLYTCGC